MKPVSVAVAGSTPAEIAAFATEAEAAGVDSVWAIELFRSAFTQATFLATQTERADVGTGIAWAFTRSAMSIAMSAMDIDEISGGRFRLGLGAGVKALNERWHNAEYGRPAPHLRETIEAVRTIVHAAANQEPVRYEGTYHDLDIRGWVRSTPPPRAEIPIYCAAVQKGMARIAGDVADGMLGHPMCSADWIEQQLIPAYEEGLARSARDRSSFKHIASICCAIDEDEEAALDAARRTVAFYATVKSYLPLYELHGFGAEAAAAAEAFKRGDVGAVPAAIPDAMVERFCAVGPSDKVRRRVAEIAERVDGIMPGPPTYFLPEEQVAEYNRRILRAFGSSPSTPPDEPPAPRSEG